MDKLRHSDDSRKPQLGQGKVAASGGHIDPVGRTERATADLEAGQPPTGRAHGATCAWEPPKWPVALSTVGASLRPHTHPGWKPERPQDSR